MRCRFSSRIIAVVLTKRNAPFLYIAILQSKPHPVKIAFLYYIEKFTIQIL